MRCWHGRLRGDGGAAGSLVEQGFKCAEDGGDDCSASAFASSAVTGAVTGALGGALGVVGALAATTVAVCSLIRRAWYTHRWDTRPASLASDNCSHYPLADAPSSTTSVHI